MLIHRVQVGRQAQDHAAVIQAGPHDADCPVLFHCTAYANLESIARQGLLPEEAGRTWTHGGFEHISRGKVFLADGWDAARGWYDGTSEILEYNQGDVDAEDWGEEALENLVPVTLRLALRPKRLFHDPAGGDRVAGSVWTDQAIRPETLLVWRPPWRGQPGRWDSLLLRGLGVPVEAGVAEWIEEDGARWPELKGSDDETGFFPPRAEACRRIGAFRRESRR